MPKRDLVDLPKIIEWTIDEIRKIDESDRAQKEKTRAHARLASRVKTKLTDDQRLREDDRLAPSSLRRYMTNIRNAITQQNWRHHGLDQQIDRLARRFPEYAEDLYSLLSIESISDLRVAHRELANRIRTDGDGVAYQEVAGMKLDHEIMRHLTLPAIHKANLSFTHAESLEQRATNTVLIDYAELIGKIDAMMKERQQLPDGTWGPVRNHMSLALALATGRRAWEVLVLGRFKKVGEFEIEFRGQAKKRGGVDYGASYRIYTLIAADQVMAGIEALRAIPEVAELQSLDNREFSLRTASSLNRAARHWLGDERVFKDSRAIWARCVFDLHFRVDKRWRTSNETVFWREQLGHEDMDTQESYKQFKIDYSKLAVGATESDGPASRIEALEQLDDNEEIQKRQALAKIHEWVKEQIREFPEAPITQSLISRELGSGRPMIKDYLAIAEQALATENRGNAIKAYVPPAELAKPSEKPKLETHHLDDGTYLATARINGEIVAEATAGSRIDAMRQAFDAAAARR